jgi:hypothetical protein
MDIEHTSSLDEAKLLGYFETIKSVFLLKLRSSEGHRPNFIFQMIVVDG